MSGNIHLERSEIRIAASANLETWSSSKWEEGVQIDRLNDLDTLVVKTQNSTYEITIISGRDGDILVRGGEFFPQNTPARLSGATLGGAFLKLRGIYVGFRMEILHEGSCIITSPVNSIAMAL
jgi:hypothetical protein